MPSAPQPLRARKLRRAEASSSVAQFAKQTADARKGARVPGPGR